MMQMSPNLNLEPPQSSSDPRRSVSMTGGAGGHARNASRNAQTVPLEVCPTTVCTLGHPLLPYDTITDTTDNSTMTQYIMDLKLQLAECLSANDTLRHQNRMLTKHNDQLIREGSKLATDLDEAYAQITTLKRERDEAVRDLTRARMLQIRQDSSRRAKLLADKEKGSEKSGDAAGSKSQLSGTSSCKDAGNNKGGNWLSRLSIHIKPSSSSNHDSLSSTSSSNNIMEPSSSSSEAAAASLQSISTSTRNLFNGSILSFLTADLGSESLLVDPSKSNSNSSLLAVNDVLPGRRSSLVMVGATKSDYYTNDQNSNNSDATMTCHSGHSRGNTDKDVQGFLSRMSMSSDASLFGESDSEEEFDDYLFQDHHHRRYQDDDESDDEDDEDAQDHKKSFDATKEGKGIGAAESVALDTYHLPKRLSLNAREA